MKLENPKQKDWASTQLLTLSVLTFLLSSSFYFLVSEMLFFNEIKQKKSWQIGNIFLRVFAIIAKVPHFSCIISFRERAHGKIHSRRVDKNNRESVFYLFWFFYMKSVEFISKCVLIINLSIEHYMEDVIRY